MDFVENQNQPGKSSRELSSTNSSYPSASTGASSSNRRSTFDSFVRNWGAADTKNQFNQTKNTKIEKERVMIKLKIKMKWEKK